MSKLFDVDNEVEDLVWEHSQHASLVKGVMGRYCSECAKEHEAIIKRINPLAQPLYDHQARVEDAYRMNPQ